MLGYLAASPGHRRARDAVSTLLWAGTDDTRARASVRNEVFVVRRELGEDADALVLDGPDLVLDPAVVETDLAAFERGAAGPASELGPVVALHDGELLAGFGLPEPNFEEWLRI